MQLIKIHEIVGKITLKSGLHIGAGDLEMHIGGIDNSVIKHPHTLQPYIPGSSLKGKVRSLLELRSGLMGTTRGKPVSLAVLKALKERNQEAEACEKILKLFGSSGADVDEDNEIGPTRISFADCPLHEQWTDKAAELGYTFTEVKPENSIDRVKGTAENPRFTERVPAGVEFKFRMSLKEFEGDGDLLPFLLEGLKLLEMDTLGGSGSRGYGRIQLEFVDEKIQQQFDFTEPM